MEPATWEQKKNGVYAGMRWEQFAVLSEITIMVDRRKFVTGRGSSSQRSTQTERRRTGSYTVLIEDFQVIRSIVV